jgi:diguanylate cyclase (GGDEF)-like protein
MAHIFSVYRVLTVVRDFEALGGASLGLVAWELDVEEATVATAWNQAQAGGLLEPAGIDPVHGEEMSRLTALGWTELGVSPDGDRRRRDAVARLGSLDRLGNPALASLTRIASHLTGGAATVVHIFDERYQRRIAAVNVPLGEHPAHDSMFRLVVDDAESAESIICADASNDPRFAYTSIDHGADPIRFYASIPLRTYEGTIVGMLCAFDTVARELTEEQISLFEDLAVQVVSNIEFTRLAVDLGHLASHDPLTGVVNRLLLPDRLRHALARQRRRGGNVLVAVVDLDGFKRINDVYGHAAGDEVLTVLAHRLRKAMRDEDTVARLGGDEFVVITEVPREGEEAQRIVARIRNILTEPIPFNGLQLRLSASVGAAIAEAGDDETTALARADRDLYGQKQGASAP